MSSSGYEPHPSPEYSFSDSLSRIQSMQSKETSGYNPILRTTIFSHGKKTNQAILWFHGYTSGTQQFKPIGEMCFSKGMNVLIPCQPHHGFLDRMTDEVSKIKTKELVAFAENMVDIMHGLGDEVLVGGLSMGGVMASWVAQFRPDVSLALIIAPFLGAYIIPTPLTSLVAAGIRILPDNTPWWDPDKKENLDGVDFGYPRYSTKSLGHILKMGDIVFSAARGQPPQVKKVKMVINDHDKSVNNVLCQKLVDYWTRNGAKDVSTYHFSDALGLPHDCVSEWQPNGNTRLVYTALMKMIEGREIK